MSVQGVQRENSESLEREFDTGAIVWLLASLAGFYRQPFDAELVLKRFPPPIDLPTLIEALGALGLKAGVASWPKDDFCAVPLPAVAFIIQAVEDDASPKGASSSPAIVVRHDDQTIAWVRPGEDAPQVLSLDAAEAQCLPVLLLLSESEPPLTESVGETEDAAKPKKAFGFSWFIPELLRHKSLWCDILLASLAIQLVGLATPLFTQVIIDKVIAHHSESTLIVQIGRAHV